MIKFFKFLELARDFGVANMKNGLLNDVPPEKLNWDPLRECRPFVFVPKPIDGQSAIDVDLNATEIGDLPFRVCSFELLGQSTKFSEVNVGCLVVIEHAPHKYDFFVLAFNRENWEGRVCQVDQSVGAPILDYFLRRLSQEKTGIESIRTTIKMGFGKNKRTERFRQIIHVSPKKYTGGPSGETGRHIDWSHRFEVRGHWRKFDGIGKDRRGQPVDNGHTWVRPHQKGPEHLPLIKKTRVVK